MSYRAAHVVCPFYLRRRPPRCPRRGLRSRLELPKKEQAPGLSAPAAPPPAPALSSTRPAVSSRAAKRSRLLASPSRRPRRRPSCRPQHDKPRRLLLRHGSHPLPGHQHTQSTQPPQRLLRSGTRRTVSCRHINGSQRSRRLASPPRRSRRRSLGRLRRDQQPSSVLHLLKGPLPLRPRRAPWRGSTVRPLRVRSRSPSRPAAFRGSHGPAQQLMC